MNPTCFHLSVLFILLISTYSAESRIRREEVRRSRFIGSTAQTKTTEDGLKQYQVIVHAPKVEEDIHWGNATTNSSESSSSNDDDSDNLFEEDQGDSDVSEERNPEDLNNGDLSPVNLDGNLRRADEAISVINSAFNNRKSFSCPRIKSDFLTGTTTANISPEDIGIIAAMGDSLATGAGLWPRTDIEFRGAAFPIGGDATIDGLVTVPNILREFSDLNTIHGVSHGMGLRDQLPEHQLNVAASGASSASMPEQATELVRRFKLLKEVDIYNTWAMVIITVGSEEVCANCTGPDTQALMDALDILNRGIHKAFVVLLGPIHVSSAYQQQANLLKTRCECSREKDEVFMQAISAKWANGFDEVQRHVESVKRKTFNALSLSMLTVTSRYPYSLFIPNKPLLNRRGHNYAAKWLWNRLIAGPKYNLSKAVLSQDAYFCPSLGCPYFRNTDNFNYCRIKSLADAKVEQLEEEESEFAQKFGRTRFSIYVTSVVIISIALVTVLTLGTIFYNRSKKGSTGRFDSMPIDYYVHRSRAATNRSRAATTRSRAPTKRRSTTGSVSGLSDADDLHIDGVDNDTYN